MSGRLYIAASRRWSLMCEMISPKECLHVIEIRCLVAGMFFLCNFMVLIYELDGQLRIVSTRRGRGSFPWPRLSMIMIMGFQFYRDAVQLHVTVTLFYQAVLVTCVDVDGREMVLLSTRVNLLNPPQLI